MSSSRVTLRGRVTIPREIRKHLALEPGDQIDFSELASGAVVVTKAATSVRRPQRRVFGFMRGRLTLPADLEAPLPKTVERSFEGEDDDGSAPGAR